MIKKIKSLTNKKVEIRVDVKLGRFFTRNQRYNPSVRDSTYRKGVIIEERYNEFQDRVKEQMKDVLNSQYENIWNITHSLVILHVAKLQNIDRNKNIQYLDTLIIKNN